MKSLNWLLTPFMALLFSACAFDKNTNTDLQREIENRNLLMQKYNRVTGVYRGTVVAGVSTQTVELSFYTVDVKIGQTANGEPKFLPALMTRYRVLNTVEADVIMEATYLEETSQIFMANQGNTFGISGYFDGERITGDVIRNGGKWGTLNVTLVSRQSSAPNDANDRAERNERYTRIYEAIVGIYKGTVIFDQTVAQPFNITVTITIDQVKDKDGFYMPALKADYTPDGDPNRNLALSMDVDYIPNTEPPEIRLVSNQEKEEYSVTIAGTIHNGVITGTFTNKRAQRGKVVLRRQ